jgi:DNA-binding MarR family transcriptional regulator
VPRVIVIQLWSYCAVKRDLLEHLAACGATDANDVARRLNVSYAAAAMALLRLVRQGLVNRYLDDALGVYWYCLTEPGYDRLAYFRKTE